jgi:HSP20 family molecular chaperone IbpA
MSQLIEKKSESPARRETRLEYSTPAVNIRHDAEGFTLEVNMPGVAKNGVDITSTMENSRSWVIARSGPSRATACTARARRGITAACSISIPRSIPTASQRV